MASNHEPKKSGNNIIKGGHEGAVGASSISGVLPLEARTPGQWEQEGEDVLAAAIRTFFLSHTLDPLTGEVHTVH